MKVAAIKGVIFILVYFQEFSEAESSHIVSGDQDYQDIIPICPAKELCKGRKAEELLSRFHGCQCDEKCSFYEDCCRDSPFFSPTEVPREVPKFSCVTVPIAFAHNSPIKMVTSCPPESSSEEHGLCGTPNERTYLLSMIPVTVTSNQMIYRNVYCARCHGVSENYQLWNTTLVCDGESGRKPFPEDAEAAWDPEKKRWVYKEDDRTFQCDMKMIPDLTSVLPHVICPEDECPDGTDPGISRLCRGYTALVRLENHTYKNQYCLVCNEGSSHNSSCHFPELRHVTEDSHKYTLLMRYVRNKCGPGEYHDEIHRECIHLFPRVRQYGRSVSPIDTCVRAKLPARLYKLAPDNSTVAVPRYERNFTQGQFRLMENGTLEICEKDVTPPLKVLSFTGTIAILRLVGFAVSILFLLLHLGAVLLVAELRNLSGVTLASLCFALLCGYASFIAGITLKDSLPYFWCYTCAMTAYYFFMASFLWMLVIAFDVSKVLRASVRKFRAAHGLPWRRFTMYSFIAWGIPIISSIVVHMVENSRDNWFRPMFGLYACWFGNPQSHLVFFVVPLAVIMLLNFSCFVYAAWVTSDNPTGQRKNLRVYVKLTILLGLNWMVGLLARATDSDILWVIFSILNPLQGLFIFLSFTLTSKVSKGLSKFIVCCDKSSNEEPVQNVSVRETSSARGTVQV